MPHCSYLLEETYSGEGFGNPVSTGFAIAFQRRILQALDHFARANQKVLELAHVATLSKYGIINSF